MKSTVIQFETIPLLEDSNQTNNIDMLYKKMEEEDTSDKMSLENYQNTEIPLNLDLYTSHIHLKGQDRTSYKKSEKKTNTIDDVEKGNLPPSKTEHVTLNFQEKSSFFQKDDLKRIRELNVRKKVEEKQRKYADEKLDRLQKIYMIVLILLTVLMVVGMIYFHPLNLYWYQLSVVFCVFLLAMVINSVWIVSVHAHDRKYRTGDEKWIPLSQPKSSESRNKILEVEETQETHPLLKGNSETTSKPIDIKSGAEHSKLSISKSPIERDLYTAVRRIEP